MSGCKPSQEMLHAYNEAVTRFVAELEGVPEEQKGELHEVIWSAVMAMGRRADLFTKVLAKRFEIDINVAAAASMFQTTMGRYVKDVSRRPKIGIAESKWMSSNAHCDDAPHHEQLNGKRFRLEKGLVVRGKRIWPGSERVCRCCEGAVINIPGFD